MALSEKFGHIAKLYRYIAALCSAGCSRRKYGYCGFSFFHCFSSTVGLLGAFILLQIKVKVTLEQASKVQRGSRGIALLFL